MPMQRIGLVQMIGQPVEILIQEIIFSGQSLRVIATILTLQA